MNRRTRIALAGVAVVLFGVLAVLLAQPRAVAAPGRLAPTVASQKTIAAFPAPFSTLIRSMYRQEPQRGTDGKQYKLSDSKGVSAMDGVFLFDLARRVRPRQTLEVGFAEGFSALFFLAAAQVNGGGHHTAMDPFEITEHHGLGVQKVQEAGMTNRFRFMEAKSVAALPELTRERGSYEIIFIDGDHHYDAVFTDFILSEELCPKGGYILLHDPWMPATKKVVRYLERNRRDYARVEAPADVNIAVFRKVGEDRRDWLHFVDF